MSDVLRWETPPGLNVRGTVLVLAARGEDVGVYQRFGARVAADAYRVIALPTHERSYGVVAEAVGAEASSSTTAHPVVVIGTDSSAPIAQDIAATVDGIDAVIIAGAPGPVDAVPDSWEDQIAARSACPNHQGVLRTSAVPVVSNAGLHAPMSAPEDVTVPVLALHGSEDSISPVDAALAGYRQFPTAQVGVVEGGRHDVLNDVTHRSVAATVVLFLERLKLGPDLPAIVREVDAETVTP